MQAERFFNFMAEYNTAIWPAQIVFYLLSFVFIITAFYRVRGSNTLNILILSSLWIWNGAVTLLIYFTSFHNQ